MEFFELPAVISKRNSVWRVNFFSEAKSSKLKKNNKKIHAMYKELCFVKFT